MGVPLRGCHRRVLGLLSSGGFGGGSGSGAAASCGVMPVVLIVLGSGIMVVFCA